MNEVYKMSILRQLQAIQAGQNVTQEETSVNDNGKFEMVDPNNLPKGYEKVSKKITKVTLHKKDTVTLTSENSFSVTYNGVGVKSDSFGLLHCDTVHTAIKRLLTLYRKDEPKGLTLNYTNLRDCLNADNGKLTIHTRKIGKGAVKSLELNRNKTDFPERNQGKQENAIACNRRVKPDQYADFTSCNITDIIGIYWNNKAIFTTVKQTVSNKHPKLVSNQQKLSFEKLGYETSYYVQISDDHKWSKYRCKDGFITFKLKVLNDGTVNAKLSDTCLEQTIGKFVKCHDVKIVNDDTIFDHGMAFIPKQNLFSELLGNKFNSRLNNISNDIYSLLNTDKTRKGKDIKIIKNNLRRILENDVDTSKLEKCLTVTTRYPNTFLIGYLLDQNDQSLLIVKRLTLAMKHGDHDDIKSHLVRLTNNVKLTM